MVIGDLIPVLWLCGPPEAGKSTVGWEIFTQLTEAGIVVGYVDIDQLGMCYPEHVSDPGRHRMKAQNLGAVVANYRAAGARCVIVSGGVDPGHGPHTGMVPLAAFTVCRLRLGRDELKQRFLGRDGQAGLLAEVLSEADAITLSRLYAGADELTRRIMLRGQRGSWPQPGTRWPDTPPLTCSGPPPAQQPTPKPWKTP